MDKQTKELILKLLKKESDYVFLHRNWGLNLVDLQLARKTYKEAVKAEKNIKVFVNNENVMITEATKETMQVDIERTDKKYFEAKDKYNLIKKAVKEIKEL